ncbi:hypothetical protein AXF42_Ash011047 [Apostasia shenzhenica]|uniref:Uncharacterized protein n=1 Tax=Apostasia shenzhenica TaxID=1088818 RepID=A0A2H9ZQZ2_9ASPA|nr:hypothetical protein AXF42_Ash011047 [Apostasia shenzhenica]
MAERKWKVAFGLSKKRAGAPVTDAPSEKKMPEASVSLEVRAPTARVAGALVQMLESLQGTGSAEAAAVVVVSDSPVKPPPKAKELREVVLIGETASGEKLASGKIMLKDEEFGRFLPGVGVSDAVEGEPSLFVGRSIPLIVPIHASDATLVSEESRGLLGKMLVSMRGESLLTASEAGGLEAEKVREERGEALPAVPSTSLSIEGVWSVLGDRLSEVRRAEEKILGNTSEVLEVVKSLKGKEIAESYYLQRIRDSEDALSQVTKCSLSNQKEELEGLFQLEGRLASLAQVNAEWANKSEIARGEFNRNLADVNQAHSAHVKDLQKRLKDLDDDREALREERRRLREELTKAREALSGAKEVASEARRREELLKSEVRSLRALVENSSGWRGRRMEDLEEAVKRAVKVGHHTQHEAAFDALLQTLVNVGTLNQENIRDPAVLPFCGLKGPDRFFDARSCPSEEIPPSRSYAGWGSWPLKPGTSGEGPATPLEARWLGRILLEVSRQSVSYVRGKGSSSSTSSSAC